MKRCEFFIVSDEIKIYQNKKSQSIVYNGKPIPPEVNNTINKENIVPNKTKSQSPEVNNTINKDNNRNIINIT